MSSPISVVLCVLCVTSFFLLVAALPRWEIDQEKVARMFLSVPRFIRMVFIVKKLPLLALAALSLITLRSALFATLPDELMANLDKSPNIVAITPTSVRIIAGETRSFTVDSPRDQAPVSTAATVEQLTMQILYPPTPVSFLRNGSPLAFTDIPVKGDKLLATFDTETKTYDLEFVEAAIAGYLTLSKPDSKPMFVLTANAAPTEITLDFTAGQRTPDATVTLQIPAGINVTMDNTFVNVIGRGEVPLSGLATQSIGRTGANYPYKKVGDVTITGDPTTGQTITFTGLDLRPLNKPDLRIRITGVQFAKPGNYIFKSTYTTAEPKKYSSLPDAPASAFELFVRNRISDFKRVPLRQFTYAEAPDTYTSATLTWTPVHSAGSDAMLLASTNNGATWQILRPINLADGSVHITGLAPDQDYLFKLQVTSGSAAGDSNQTAFFSGKEDVKSRRFFGVVKGDGVTDDTEVINRAIMVVSAHGGGTIRFPAGTYNVRTLHLRSNVWLYLDADATIQCIGNCDAPEATWFPYRDPRSDPDTDPDNDTTNQDAGPPYYQNAMFTAERQDNIKIIGAGRITGNGRLTTSDRIKDNPPENRADKMFSLKHCANIEIGGPAAGEDLHIDQGGRFTLLAAGCDNIHVHDTSFGKNNAANARDICTFTTCDNVTVANLTSNMGTSAGATAKSGARHIVVLDDVTGARIENLKTTPPVDDANLIKTIQSTDVKAK